MKKHLILSLAALVFISLGFINIVKASEIPLTITAPSLTLSKEYDGLNTATVIGTGTVSGLISPDDLTVLVSAVATYDTEAAGTGKTITVVYSLSGASSTNYIKPENYTTATGVVSKKQLTIATSTEVTPSKTYDGNSTVVVTSTGTLGGVYNSEDVILQATSTYNTVTAGTGKIITIGYSLSGTKAGNYFAPQNATTSGVITQKPLTIGNPTLTLSKVYDENKNVTVIAMGNVSGFVSPDSSSTVLVSAVATYDTMYLGIGKTITVAYSLSGASSTNYLSLIHISEPTRPY